MQPSLSHFSCSIFCHVPVSHVTSLVLFPDIFQYPILHLLFQQIQYVTSCEQNEDCYIDNVPSDRLSHSQCFIFFHGWHKCFSIRWYFYSIVVWSRGTFSKVNGYNLMKRRPTQHKENIIRFTFTNGTKKNNPIIII